MDGLRDGSNGLEAGLDDGGRAIKATATHAARLRRTRSRWDAARMNSAWPASRLRVFELLVTIVMVTGSEQIILVARSTAPAVRGMMAGSFTNLANAIAAVLEDRELPRPGGSRRRRSRS